MRALVAIATLVLLLLPLRAGAEINLFSIKNSLIQFALEQISSPGSFEVTAGSVEEPGEGVTSLVDVKIADNQGVWLTVERVNFAWDPSALLSGELAITKLELIGLTVSRPPSETAEAPELKPAEPSGRGLFDWPRAPLDLSVDGVRLERVSIAEGVLPQAISFEAEGRAFDKGDLQELSLSLRRTDAVAGSISLAMRRDFAANTVRLDVQADEAPGGMVAAAAGFPADAPARLTLSADGPPEDWRLIFDAGVERVFDAAGQATLAYADRLSVAADFSVTPGPELGETARTVLGERATLTAELTEGEGGMIAIRAARLASPALTLTASGSFATGAGDSDVAVSLVALPPLAALVPGVAFDRFAFDGAVNGPRGALAAAGTMQLLGLATAAADSGLLRLDGRVSQTADGLTFDLDGRGEGLRIDRLGPQVIGPATLSVAGALAGDVLTLGTASLDSRSLNAGASGSFNLNTSVGELAVRLDAPDIAPVAAAYGAAAAGAVTASAQVALAGGETSARIDAALSGFAADRVSARRLSLAGDVSNGAGGLIFDLTGGAEALVLDKVPADLTRATAFAARGRLRDGTLSLDRLTLEADLLTARAGGTVDLDAGSMALDYSLETADLAPVARAYGAEAGGALQAAGRAEGSFDAPRLTGEASVAGAAYAGRAYGALALTHDVALAPVPEGSAEITMRGGALGDGRAAARFRLDGTRLTLGGLDA
ncbi:MAG TPA: hypothetical protein VLA52_06185, partial [Thermohalobaculum sp.]|nr:hypothetical protein [Thermohalobaculum sp.]